MIEAILARLADVGTARWHIPADLVEQLAGMGRPACSFCGVRGDVFTAQRTDDVHICGSCAEHAAAVLRGT